MAAKLISKIICLAAVALTLPPAYAQTADDYRALKKQMEEYQARTDKEMQAMRSEIDLLKKANADATAGAAPFVNGSKINISSGVTELKIYGDVRSRYQYDQTDQTLTEPIYNYDPVTNSYVVTTQKYKYVQRSDQLAFRLRIGADIQLGDQVFGGLTIANGGGSDNNTETATEDFDTSHIYVNKAFLGWSPGEWLTAVVGKQANPLYTTGLVWDPDVTPLGASEVIGPSGPLPGNGDRFSMQLIAIQSALLGADQMPQFIVPAVNDNNSHIFGWIADEQIKATYHINKDASITVAPGFLATFNDIHELPADYDSAYYTHDMAIVTAPGDITFSAHGIPAKLYWDYAYNTKGAGRFEKTDNLTNHSGTDDVAWLLGLQVGQNIRAGDWSISASYRRIGEDAVVPYLNDGNFALGDTNIQGFDAGLAYNFTDSLVGSLDYVHAWRLRPDIIDGTGFPIVDVNGFDILRVDLDLKF
jgi:hypothetical protein